MDWARVKTILIIAFLFTNIFLIYNIYNEYRYSSIIQQRVDEVIEIISQKGVKVNTDIPEDSFIQGTLTVRYREFSPQQLASSLLDNRDLTPVKKDMSTIFMGKHKKLEIKNNKEIIYLDLDLKNDLRGNLSPEDAVSMSRNFLKKTGLYTPSMTLDRIVPIEKGYSITFAQEYKGLLLEISFVDIEVTPRGVYSMHMLWLEPVGMEKGRRKIIPAAEALLKVVSRKEVLKKDSAEVESIRLVYYFNWEGAKEGEAFPAWKIKVDGKDYYINALTGQFEK